MNIKAGDTVVIAGKDKFYSSTKKAKRQKTTGKVLKAFPGEDRLLVEGVNKVKKTPKTNSTK